MSHKNSYFSWWWAYSRPKHVEKRHKHTKRNCAPSWLNLRNWTNNMCRNVVKNLLFYAVIKSPRSLDLICTAKESWNHASLFHEFVHSCEGFCIFVKYHVLLRCDTVCSLVWCQNTRRHITEVSELEVTLVKFSPYTPQRRMGGVVKVPLIQNHCMTWSKWPDL